MAEPERKTIRVATWNVHACVGGDGTFDPDRVVSLVRGCSPDVVALQEADSRRYSTRNSTPNSNSFAFFLDQIGGHAVEARTIVTDEGDYGHMVVSRWPLRRGRVHDISAAGREPRAIIDVEALSPFGPIRVFGAHFGLKRSERRIQTAALRALVETEPLGAAIVAGDFNELKRRSPTHQALTPGFQSAHVIATYPSRCPLFALDRIWCRAPLRVRECHVPRGTRAASDHLPLIADLDWIAL